MAGKHGIKPRFADVASGEYELRIGLAWTNGAIADLMGRLVARTSNTQSRS